MLRAELGTSRVATAETVARWRPGPRVPLRFSSDQPAIAESGGPRVTAVVGSARPQPATVRWSLDPEGPLAWLRTARPLTSVRLDDFSLRFG